MSIISQENKADLEICHFLQVFGISLSHNVDLRRNGTDPV